MQRGGIRKNIKNIGRGPRERCRSVPRGAPFPLFYLRHFFRAGLTIVPRSLLLNRTETLATRAMVDRESSVALCHGVALKKKGIGRGSRERCRSVPRGGVKKKGSVEDRESGIALCHKVAFKKQRERDRSRTERTVSLSATGWR